MHSRPLTSLSRILLVASAIGLGSASLLAQNSSSTAPKPTAPADAAASRIDIFLGYSYWAPHGNVTIPSGANIGINGPVSYSSINYGAIGSVSYFFNRYVGGQAEYSNHPDGNNDGASSGTLGMIFRYPTTEITPFVHAGAGFNRLGGPYKQPYTFGPALTVGGGLDYALPFLGGHLGLRLFQADYQYFHTNFGPQPPYPTGGRANLNIARLSTGLLYHMGSIQPPPPVTYTCTASPSPAFPGDPITVTGTAANLNPKKTATYSWTGNNGVNIKGDSTTGNIDTTGLAPGNYTVTGHVSEGQKPGQFADCTANFTIKQFEPPTLSCTANPTTVQPGGTATISATGVSPQNRPLTYSFTASAGQISGSGNTATLSTTGAPAGTITVTGTVQDDKGQSATCTATVDVQAPPPPPKPTTKTLCSINFDRDKRRPARVDNEAKACLDDVALNLQQQTDATAVVVGEAASTEKKPEALAAQRAVNTKDYLVKEKGIDPSRISVRTGTQGNKEVENYLVPSGATFDSDVQGTTPVDESTVKAQARTAPARHARRKKPAAQ
ncbi:MAG TPA: OmpA family protein [Acidobacteriaceae bacterium]|nr:OmpA family protein [Acidobacteriaceae bacterium]